MKDMELWNLEGAGLPLNESKRPEESLVDFPRGYGKWAVMLFTTPFEVRLGCESFFGVPGDMLINRPDTPMWHRGVGRAYQNYWIHFDPPGKISLSRYQLLIDRPFTPREGYEDLFREIHWESIEKEDGYEEAVTLLLESLFLSLHRESRGGRFPHEIGSEGGKHSRPDGQVEAPGDSQTARRDEEFLQLRKKLSRELTKSWSVEEMARSLSLSPSRFAVLYKERFGTSPINDLNRFRMEYARQLLSYPAISVKQAALESGFRDLPWFNRYFKAQTGFSPGRWRCS